MAGFKKSQPGLRFSSEKITPDEEDIYYNYQISQPGTASSWWASAGTAGTSSVVAYTIINRLPDYPRNINYILAGSAAGMTGTFVTNGYDQFGSVVSETVTITPASNGGTTVGTQPFARVDSGTLSYGTAIGSGTPQIGFVPGTGCLFGLPVKIGSATDVVFYGMTAGTGAISVNGGTIAGFVGTQYHTIRAAAALTGSQTINLLVKSSFVPDNVPVVSNLKQAV